MNSSRPKLEVLSWVAGIATAAVTFYTLLVSPTTQSNETKNQVITPSFNCVKASNKVERLICTSPEIAILDLAMANAYRDVWAEQKGQEQRKSLKSAQINWLREVRGSCIDTTCLKSIYEQRITELNNAHR